MCCAHELRRLTGRRCSLDHEGRGSRLEERSHQPARLFVRDLGRGGEHIAGAIDRGEERFACDVSEQCDVAARAWIDVVDRRAGAGQRDRYHRLLRRTVHGEAEQAVVALARRKEQPGFTAGRHDLAARRRTLQIDLIALRPRKHRTDVAPRNDRTFCVRRSPQ
jgi:hypothetical protein